MRKYAAMGGVLGAALLHGTACTGSVADETTQAPAYCPEAAPTEGQLCDPPQLRGGELPPYCAYPSDGCQETYQCWLCGNGNCTAGLNGWVWLRRSQFSDGPACSPLSCDVAREGDPCTTIGAQCAHYLCSSEVDCITVTFECMPDRRWRMG